MHFSLIDRVLELSEERIVALKCVTGAEEYLQDHFPTFPVLPGVLMLETLTQAARRLLGSRDAGLSRHVLGEVKALKYGSFVRPGDGLRVRVELLKEREDGVFEFRGSGEVLRAEQAPREEAPTCVSGRFTLRAPRLPW